MRICIIGGGLAGTLLAWRLCRADHSLRIDLITGDTTGGTRGWDATAASGGAVRAYERHPVARALATASLVELLGSEVLRAWSRYVRVGSVYLRPAWWEGPAEVAAINRVVPGSARLSGAYELRRLGWGAVGDGTVAVIEAQAGYVDPDALRHALRAELARHAAVRVEPVVAVPVPHGTGNGVTCRVGGETRRYDLLVIAAGGWTPALLAAAFPGAAAGYRIKAIQYALHPATGRPPTVFVDEITGLYGRPVGHDKMLLGVPVPVFGGSPRGGDPEPDLAAEAGCLAERRLPEMRLGPHTRLVRAADCYADPPTFALRPVAGHRGVFTFTGGSGGSVKTALAASRLATTKLLTTGLATTGPATTEPAGTPLIPKRAGDMIRMRAHEAGGITTPKRSHNERVHP